MKMFSQYVSFNKVPLAKVHGTSEVTCKSCFTSLSVYAEVSIAAGSLPDKGTNN